MDRRIESWFKVIVSVIDSKGSKAHQSQLVLGDIENKIVKKFKKL